MLSNILEDFLKWSHLHPILKKSLANFVRNENELAELIKVLKEVQEKNERYT